MPVHSGCCHEIALASPPSFFTQAQYSMEEGKVDTSTDPVVVVRPRADHAKIILYVYGLKFHLHSEIVANPSPTTNLGL